METRASTAFCDACLPNFRGSRLSFGHQAHLGSRPDMGNGPNLLVRYARLKKGDRSALFGVAAKHSPAVVFDQAVYNAHLTQVVDDRLVFADRLLAFSARQLNSAPASSDPNVNLRMALARSCYTVHRALRAMHVSFVEWGLDGHKETIELVEALRVVLQKVSAAKEMA